MFCHQYQVIWWQIGSEWVFIFWVEAGPRARDLLGIWAGGGKQLCDGHQWFCANSSKVNQILLSELHMKYILYKKSTKNSYVINHSCDVIFVSVGWWWWSASSHGCCSLKAQAALEPPNPTLWATMSLHCMIVIIMIRIHNTVTLPTPGIYNSCTPLLS